MLHRARADDRGGDRGVAHDERDRHLDQRDPGLLGELGELLGGVELALVGRDRQVEASGWAARREVGPAVGVLALAAGEPAAGQRAVGDHAHPVALAGGQHVVLDRAGEDRVRRLLAAEALAAARARPSTAPRRSATAGKVEWPK